MRLHTPGRSHGAAWAWALGALVIVRAAVPLAALAASGHRLPGLPFYEYDGLSGDATGFYAAAREFIASVPRLGKPVAIVLALALIAAWAALGLLWRQGRLASHLALIGAAAAGAVLVTAAVEEMAPPGAAVFGWPLLWSLPLFPLRALHLLGVRSAFGAGLALALVANAATVVATAYVGLRATGRRSVGLGGAALFACWPLLSGVVAGHRGWGNGTWNVDAGLALYTEPVSTALVTGSLAILLAPRLTSPSLAAAGITLGLATLVKVSNGLIALVLALVVLAEVGPRRVAPMVAGGLTLAPVLAAYWPIGYPEIEGPTAARPAIVHSAAAALHNWTASLLFHPRTLVVLLPLAAVGCVLVRSRRALAVLVLPVIVNAAVYTPYRYTAEHPRFLFVSLPPVLTLWAAGAGAIVFGARNSWRERRRAATIISG